MTDRPVTLVTAAGSGMGEAIARRLHDEGHRLVLLSSGGGAMTLAHELGCEAVTGSVTDAADLGAMVDLAVQRFGGVDNVVANTGHAPKGELLGIPDDDWHGALDLLLLHVVRLARLTVPSMRERGGGSIVSISTFSAFEPSPAFPVSSVIRAGLGSFTKLFAREHAGDGIRMNAVLPGFIDSYPESDENVAMIPAGRYGTTGEVADVVRFLVSDESTYVTGQNIVVDGGLTRGV